MSSEKPHLPHLPAFDRQPVVFVTTVTHERRTVLACQTALRALVTTWTRSPIIDGWYVGKFIIMPDHVHLFARPALDAKPLSAWMQTWKSITSRQLAAALSVDPPIWQKDYFDRYLRSAENYQQKWWYLELNPVRKALCTEPKEWPWQGELFHLQF